MTKQSHKRNLVIKIIRSERGDSFAIFLLGLLLFLYLILPIFAAVIEKHIVQLKAFDIKEAIELSSISTYDSLSSESLSENIVEYDSLKAQTLFKSYLAKNLNLNSDLTPKGKGIVEGSVTVNSFAIYTSGFPHTCPSGKLITKPSIHAEIVVPIKPTLYRNTILQTLGVNTIGLKFHYDHEIVIDN